MKRTTKASKVKPDSENFPLRLPKHVIARLRAQAKRECRTASNLARLLLETGMAARRGMTS